MQTLVVVIDFTQARAVDQLLQKIKELEVGVLVNNVGMMGPHFIPFLETERETVQVRGVFHVTPFQVQN